MDVATRRPLGDKQWLVYAPQIELPLPHQKFKPYAASLGEPILNVTLKPGDILYLPRGYGA